MNEEYDSVKESINASLSLQTEKISELKDEIKTLKDKIKSLIDPSKINSLCIDGKMIVNWEVTDDKNSKDYPDLSKAKDVFEKEDMLINYYIKTQLEPAITALIHRQFQKEVDEYLQSLKDEGKI